MNGDTPAATGRAQRVFISYSGADRGRVSGLGLLLEALGHEVFLDHKTIKPGERWEAKLEEGLGRADVLLVFWTKHAARSDWVRKELEHFHVDFPQRLLVPVLGDETPLSELLKPYQQSDFCPLINELLALKRNMQQQNVKPAQIQQAILDRLREAGIEVPSKDRKKLFGLFSSTGLVGLFTTPLLFLQQLATSGLEAAAQLSGAQTVLVGAAAVSGGVLCAVAGQLGGSGSVEIGTLEYPKTIISDNPASNLTVRYSGNPAFPLEIVFQFKQDLARAGLPAKRTKRLLTNLMPSVDFAVKVGFGVPECKTGGIWTGRWCCVTVLDTKYRMRPRFNVCPARHREDFVETDHLNSSPENTVSCPGPLSQVLPKLNAKVSRNTGKMISIATTSCIALFQLARITKGDEVCY